MLITTFVQQYANLTPTQMQAQVRIRMTPDGTYSFPKWDVSNVQPPTAAQIATALATINVSELGSALVAAASTVTSAITQQIVTEPVHQTAYPNAAAMVPNGVLPTADPDKTTFSNYAAAFGMGAQPFANLVLAIRDASLVLSGAQAALNAAATNSSATVTSLNQALNAFETTVQSVISDVQAVGVTITAPAAISIVGLNA